MTTTLTRFPALRWGSVLGLLCGALCGIWCGARSARAGEQVLLSRVVGAVESTRQLRVPASPGGANGAGVDGGGAGAPWMSPDWMRPDFDDTAWGQVAPQAPSSSPLLPGTLWLTPPLSSSAAREANGVAATPAAGSREGAVDGGLIFSEESAADGGAGHGTASPPAGAVDAGVSDGGTGAPVLPACAGTLYLRRRFAPPPGLDLAKVSLLTLRIRYSDGVVAYLNGTELVRRRLPVAALTDPSTLAAERGPVEPESYHLPLTAGLLLPEGNVLAVEVHPRAVERCPRVELELTASDGPRVVRGPYIERMIGGTIDLALETNSATTLSLRYGKGDALSSRDRVVADEPGSQPQTSHRAHLTGLRPGTTYHYQVTLTTPSGGRVELPTVPLHTPPATGRPLRFVVYGDSRSGHSIHAQLVQTLVAEDPDLILCTGDVVERGTEESDWDRYFAVAAPLIERIPVFLAPGNHEYARRGQGAQRLFQLWDRLFVPQPPVGPAQGPPPSMLANLRERSTVLGDPVVPRGYYSFDVGGVHFIGLDSNQSRSAEQLRWLEADLARATSRKPRGIVVWMHDGPYSAGWHGDNGTLIRDYVPLFERHRVSVVFSGHDHDYERGRRGNINYVVTGGGGAELRPLKCGVPGKRKCKHPPLAFYNDHNYVAVEVLPDALRLCAKRIDGTPLEPCQILRR